MTLSVNEALQRYIKKYRYNYPEIPPPLEPGGVYMTDIRKSALFAGKNDMAVCFNFMDTFKKSDIIFVFMSENGLRSIASKMERSGIRNKIICHFNPHFNADILDFGSENTYVSFLIPILEKAAGVYKAHHLIAEGYGDRFDEVKYLADMMEMECIFLNSKEKNVYTTGIDFLNTYTYMMKKIGVFLIETALASEPDVCNDIIKKLPLKEYISNPVSDITKLDYDYVLRQEKVLKDIDLKYIKKAYAGVVASINQYIDADPDLKKALSRKTKRIFSS